MSNNAIADDFKGLSKLKKKLTGGLDGRQPGVETGMCYQPPQILVYV